MRTFSLQEAQSLVPVLEGLLRTSIDGKKVIEEVEKELSAINEHIFVSGGAFIEVKKVALRRAERDKAVQRVRDALAEIDAIGVQVKDLDIGLLDFPCSVDGEVLLLCWKLGEASITHWHGTEEGFAGRKPIDDRISRAKSQDIN
jgi:hypothetical protein